MRLLVGLGNPGIEYQDTRHNLGFKAVEAVAGKMDLSWRKFKDGLLAECGKGEQRRLLFKPQTFMNCSGIPVKQVVDYFKIPYQDICIVADDVYIAPGSARIRQTGGDGGHNGWRSIIEHLGADEYWRVRVGVGVYEQHPEKRLKQPPLEEYVLQPLPKHEQKLTQELIDKLVPLLVNWLERGEIAEQGLHA